MHNVSTPWVLAAAALVLTSTPALAAPPSPPAAPPAKVASAPTPLDRFLAHLHTLRVRFRQTLVDAHGGVLSHSVGTLIVQRPGKFRWSIHALDARGGGQLMVADGRNLWFYDRALQQVTVQPLSAALAATPAMLLSGSVDVRKAFRERLAGRREGLNWVYVTPRQASGADFRSALFGFERGTLKKMILEDTLGQVATVTFQHIRINGPVPSADLRFTPPPGVDVIGHPLH
jgi:outer membrane lipoprotein carrier protein